MNKIKSFRMEPGIIDTLDFWPARKATYTPFDHAVVGIGETESQAALDALQTIRSIHNIDDKSQSEILDEIAENTNPHICAYEMADALEDPEQGVGYHVAVYYSVD